MNKNRMWIVLLVLAVASLACNAVMGGAKVPTATPVASISSDESVPTDEAEPPADNPSGGGDSHDSEFPLPDGISNFMEIGGVTNFQTTLSLKDAMEFYRDEFEKKGYTERELLTVTSDSTFNLVFDGHASGKAIVIQGVDLGGGSTNVSISLQAIN